MKRGNKRKFGREFQQRRAFLKGLLTALITNGRIRTTEARAKTIRGEADKLITRAKQGTLASRRLLLTKIGTVAVQKLTADIAPKMTDRSGGYTRITKLGQRTADGASMAIIEFIS